MSWPCEVSSAPSLTLTGGEMSSGDREVLQAKTTQASRNIVLPESKEHHRGRLWKVLLHNGIEDTYERKISRNNSPSIFLDHLLSPEALWLASNPTCKK